MSTPATDYRETVMSTIIAPADRGQSHATLIATDETYRVLAARRDRLGDELDAATDGAFHHSMPAEMADVRLALTHREYDRAVREFHTYRTTGVYAGQER